MGFLDDLTKNIDGGIKSVQGWGAAATETLRNISPTTKAIGGELDKLTGKNDAPLILEKVSQDATETLRNISPTTKAIGGELDKLTGKNDDKLIIEQVGETIQNIPDWYVETTKKNIDGAVAGATDFVDQSKQRLDNVVNTTTSTIEKTIIVPVKETVQNVTKGVSEALPIVALGAGGLILASLLLGRR